MHLAFVHNSAARGGNALKFAQLALPNTTTDSSLNKYTIPQLFLILHTSNVAAYTKYLYLIGSAAQFVQMRHLFSNSAVSLCLSLKARRQQPASRPFDHLSNYPDPTPTQLYESLARKVSHNEIRRNNSFSTLREILFRTWCDCKSCIDSRNSTLINWQGISTPRETFTSLLSIEQVNWLFSYFTLVMMSILVPRSEDSLLFCSFRPFQTTQALFVRSLMRGSLAKLLP